MQTIIYLGKEKLIGAKVDEKKGTVSETYELGWDVNTLDLSLGKLTEKLKVKKFRLLLDDFFSYVLRMSIPNGLSESEERVLISGNISEKIPEILSDKDWDYKEIQFDYTVNTGINRQKEKDVLVFSPVRYVMELLTKAISKLGLTVEAMEPVEIAVTRSSNPIVGLAMKQDLNGKDKEVLNISLTRGKNESDFKDVLSGQNTKNLSADSVNVQDEVETLKIQVGTKKKSFFIKFMTLITIIIFIFVVGFFLYKTLFENSSGTETSSQTIVPTAVLQITITSTPVKEEINLSEYKVLLKNGSGVKGEAQTAVSLIEAAGFTQFETGNADSYDYTSTLVFMKKEIPNTVFELLSGALEESYLLASESAVLSDSEYDIEIIIGAK